jgi:hypothetical protein
MVAEERTSPHSVLSSEVVKALTSEIISDRPVPHPTAATHLAGTPIKKPALSVQTSHTKRLSEESIKSTPSTHTSGSGSSSSRKKADSPLVSSRGGAPTEAPGGGSELDSFLKRKKESSSGAKKSTIR